MKLLLPVLCFVLMSAVQVSGQTWVVNPDGSGDALTIQQGVLSSSEGDSILVTSGTYYEKDILVQKGRTLRSLSGDPSSVTIDGQGGGRCFSVESTADSTSKIEGFTVTGGYASSSGGGAMFLSAHSIVIRNCIFVGNFAQTGGAIECRQCSPTIEHCTFENNSTSNSGGAMYFWQAPANISHCNFYSNHANSGGAMTLSESSPTITYCVFSGDSSESRGGALLCDYSSSPTVSYCTFANEDFTSHDSGTIHLSHSSSATFENCIIAFGRSTSIMGEGVGIYCDVGITPTLTCCDVFGNPGGDWVGCIAGQAGNGGNFSADPRFCDMPRFGLGLEDCSPCLPGYHPSGYDCGGIVGAFGVDCACGAALVPTTWGSIKAMHK